MITKKPSVFIYVKNANERILKEICAGIEEEGVFYEVREVDVPSLDELAWQASNDSMPGSGIGILGSQAALQMRGLDKGRNVAVLYDIDSPQSHVTAALWDSDMARFRILGSNSARAVKKMAFK